MDRVRWKPGSQQRFWVIGLRNALRSIKPKCVRCRRLAVEPVHPHMMDLPKERVEANVYPFKKTGVDGFSPFEVTVLRKPLKHWCCLFTCLVTRAVHIEVVKGLDTDACIMGVTRFMVRRGRPHTVISDNEINLLELLESPKSASESGTATQCVSDWHVGNSYGSSIFRELRTLVEVGRGWYAVARKPCSRFLEIDVSRCQC